jgi:hypothetical protein
MPPAGDRELEDWVASTTALAGEQSLGVTVLPDGRSLKAVIEEQPEDWLGQAHVDGSASVMVHPGDLAYVPSGVLHAIGCDG